LERRILRLMRRVWLDLRAGMLLVYSSDGNAQPPWAVESVVAGAPLKPGADCARVRIRRQPAQIPEESRLCVETGMLHGWDATRNAWLPQRPVGPGMELTINRPNGDVIRYVTGNEREETVGAIRLRVLETTVITSDSAGRPLRRLRERYALTLTTATGGRFEVPDPNAPDGWRTQQAFELTEIRLPH
jgi:hypothetical protein